MKKFFSFVAAVLFAGSMMAGVAQIKFTEAVAAEDLAENASFTAAGSAFAATITDPDNKMSIDANDCRFGTGESYNIYNFRLKTGGKSSSTKNFITLNIPEAGTLCLAVRTGKNSDTDRNLVIKQGEAELYNQAIVETMAIDVTEGEATVKVYPFVQVAVEAGEVILSYPTNGLNFYALALITEDVVPAGTTCAEVYNMAKNDVIDLLNPVTVTFANGKNVWVKDETASMLIFLPAASEAFKAGDVLSNIAGVVDVYNGIHEVKPSAAQVDDIVIAEGEAPAAEEVETVAATDVNKYIVMKGIAFETAAAFEEGSQQNLVINDVTVRNQFKNGFAFEAGKIYDIYGVVTLYQNNPQVYFISAEEAGDVPPTPSINYYVAGSMGVWGPDEAYRLTPNNQGLYEGEFTFAANDEFKVIGYDGTTVTWFPEGMNNNYVITEAGDYKITFNPAGNVEGWYEGFFNVVKKEAPSAITCADVYSMAKNDVIDLLNPVVVTFANAKNVWVKDETASMLIYLPAASEAFKAGDVLSNIAGVVDVYNGIHEVKPSAAQVDDIVIAEGEAPAAEVVETVAATDVNKYIVMKGIAFETAAAFEEGSQQNLVINDVTVRNQFKNGFAFEAGKIYDIYGVVTLYQNNPQLYFITAEEATTPEEGVENVAADQKASKKFENGVLIIEKNGIRYNATGAIVK